MNGCGLLFNYCRIPETIVQIRVTTIAATMCVNGESFDPVFFRSFLKVIVSSLDRMNASVIPMIKVAFICKLGPYVSRFFTILFREKLF